MKLDGKKTFYLTIGWSVMITALFVMAKIDQATWLGMMQPVVVVWGGREFADKILKPFIKK